MKHAMISEQIRIVDMLLSAKATKEEVEEIQDAIANKTSKWEVAMFLKGHLDIYVNYAVKTGDKDICQEAAELAKEVEDYLCELVEEGLCNPETPAESF